MKEDISCNYTPKIKAYMNLTESNVLPTHDPENPKMNTHFHIWRSQINDILFIAPFSFFFRVFCFSLEFF